MDTMVVYFERADRLKAAITYGISCTKPPNSMAPSICSTIEFFPVQAPKSTLACDDLSNGLGILQPSLSSLELSQVFARAASGLHTHQP